MEFFLRVLGIIVSLQAVDIILQLSGREGLHIGSWFSRRDR